MDFLEVKVTTIEKFVKEFIKDDPKLNQEMSEKLKNLSKFEEDNLDQVPKMITEEELDAPHEEFIDELLTATENLRIDDEIKQKPNPFHQYTTELQDLIAENQENETITSTSTPISIIGLNLVFRDAAYSTYLIDLFEQNFAIHSMALRYITPSLKSKTYNYINEPTIRLLCTCVYAIGSIFATHPNKKQHEQYFIAQARDSLMSITCKCKVDIYIILSIYLLSSYELGQGNLHQSYLMNAMACSLTQHMGLHISYDNDFENVNYAPKSSPLHSSILWTICLQDRLITSLVQVPCVIHFKRIISPFYKVSTDSQNNLHVSELCFSYLSRLWYIYDRYTDQIFSTNFDIGDTNNREKVLKMALKTLREIVISLPIQLRLQSLDLKKSYDPMEQNFFILIFNFNYHVAVLQLNKIFLKENPNLTRKPTVEAAVKAASILSTLAKNVSFSIDKLPYNFGYSIHSVALVLLFILTAGHTKNLSKLKAETNILELYQNCVEVLNKFATNWPSAELHLEQLQKLGDKYDLDKNYQTPTSTASSPLSKSIQSALEQINSDIANEQFLREFSAISGSSNQEEMEPFQFFEAQFPMYDWSQQPPIPPFQPQPVSNPQTGTKIAPQLEQQINQQVNQVPINQQAFPQFYPQVYQQETHQPPYQEQKFQSQSQNQYNRSTSSKEGSDNLPLDEEFIQGLRVPEFPINF